MLGRFAPGIRRADGPGQVTGDVRNKIMCYFATIGISSDASKQIGIPKRSGFHLFSYQNPNLTKALPAGFSTLAFTTGGCSCGICKPTREDKNKVSLRADAAEFLQDMTKSHGDLYFFIHWYSGDISTESLSPLGGPGLLYEGIRSSSFLHDRIIKLNNPNNAIHRTPTRRHARC